jgi:hypothetical protein
VYKINPPFGKIHGGTLFRSPIWILENESIYLNITTNYFLEGINFNYSYTPLNTPGSCRQDYVMLEVHTANSIPNIPSRFILVILERKNAIPVTNYCKAIKVIKNIESNSVKVKLLASSCNIQIKDKPGY